MAKICAFSWLLIFMTVNEMNCVLGHLKGQPCSAGRIWHNTNEGSYVCCAEKICQAGQFIKLCKGLGFESTCHPCPPGQFRASAISSLSGIYQCLPGQVESGKPDGIFITAIVLPISLSAAGTITIMVITKLCIRKNENGGVVVSQGLGEMMYSDGSVKNTAEPNTNT